MGLKITNSAQGIKFLVWVRSQISLNWLTFTSLEIIRKPMVIDFTGKDEQIRKNLQICPTISLNEFCKWIVEKGRISQETSTSISCQTSFWIVTNSEKNFCSLRYHAFSFLITCLAALLIFILLEIQTGKCLSSLISSSY